MPAPDDPLTGHPGDTRPPNEMLSPLIPGRGGRPSYSLEALRERVERQFQSETAGREDILRELNASNAQRELVTDIVDYVLAVESITLDSRSQAALIDAAHGRLFGFGPLEPLIADETITEITVDGPDTIAVRHGLGGLERVAAGFDDNAHLADVTGRLLAHTAEPIPDGTIAERGAALQDRPARVTVVAPPLSAAISVHIRLHPRQPMTLDALHAHHGTLPSAAIPILGAILRANLGMLIVGEAGAGKTTLTGAIAALLPPDASVIAVERAAELALPAGITRETVSIDRTFPDALIAALGQGPDWLLVDELRGDESLALWEALSKPDAPPGIWVWRGASPPERLRSALNMALRREQPALTQSAIDAAWADHFPFVAALRATPEGGRLVYLAETRLTEDTLRIVPLITYVEGAWQMTGQRPMHALKLSDEFWATSP